MNKGFIEEIILAKGVKYCKGFSENTGRGLDFEIPEDCDLIILMGNKGGGFIPYKCLLPHQVYEFDIIEDFEEHKFEVIYVVGINSTTPFQIAYNGEYGKKRWENE